MEFLDYVMDFALKNHFTLQPLGVRALEQGITICAENADGVTDITEELKDVRRNADMLRELAGRTTTENDGATKLYFAGHEIFRMTMDGHGNHDIHLVFMEGKAAEFFSQLGSQIEQLREAMVTNFTDEDVCDMIDIAAEFLAVRDGENFAYTLYAEGKPFLAGKLDGADFDIQLVDIMIYLKTALFMLKGRNFINVKITSPMDLLKLFESIRANLKHLGNSFSISGILVNAGVSGQTVFAAGRDVKPNFTSAFGPINIKLDSIFRIVSSVFSKM